MKRKTTKKIYVGHVPVGGDAPITVQSMTNTKTKDIEGTVSQILRLEDAGCEIIRFAVNDNDDVAAIAPIKSRIHIPVVVDIQFDYRLAVASAIAGADCIRINPGNIGNRDKVYEVVAACKDKNIPIRVGVNSGSLHQDCLDEFGGVNEQSMVQSGLREINVLESMGFNNLKISLKASDVGLCIRAYEAFSSVSDYPLHLGITEAGPSFQGTIKSAVGMGVLLNEGIGDTIRVSLTADPVEEVRVGLGILKSLGLRQEGIDIVSCPTCARTNIDLLGLVDEAQMRLADMDKNLKVALMGCAVNGPGEAREADIGIAGGRGEGLIFKKGKILRKVPESCLLDALIEEIERM
ncbi:flavodoxin-dependent (E)-4-hydroxy-3-methylbut-2-enyl-diphosphate synthase [Peptoniphilus equinus]|uniref:4-hydroxy-3-methylbut-2-en-1-yl diphosphate synthase (flavodoxin) n=1 Tax=Peptoniphilus equinus TaxID=3016343 RepID=A0ABY7QV58_9FIRM|nr:flavodoxin-dependent (E)-4-hydroxy-3-methylbut-2-enyl-diphosphate synthase [Peptoniphilus equinus]WBW50673.1 flavodoxin-dependent (E)-4-hydroxy-3-methylbut-2-enyl-diphosphate synthase [Peptoniphilus equinus]